MNPLATSLQPHTYFTEVKIHTAKCDYCEKRNGLTIYRCTQCSQHVCSLCWSKSGDEMHVFGGGSRDVPESNSSKLTESGNGGGQKGNENTGKARARRRDISDAEDNNFPVLRPASTEKKIEAADARKQPHDWINVVMDISHQHHCNRPGNGPPVLKLAEPTVNTSPAASAHTVIQRNPHNHTEVNSPEHQRTIRVYEESGKQVMPNRNALISDQEPYFDISPPPKSSILVQQATHSALHYAQPTTNRSWPGVNVDQQAAHYQRALANSQPTNPPAPRPVQRPFANQQDPRLLQPVIYRPRPGRDVDQQAARNQLAFANEARSIYQAPRPGQGYLPHQQGAPQAPLLALDSVSTSQRSVQTAANLDQAAIRNQQASHVQKMQAYAAAKETEARNRQALASRQNAWPAANRDQTAAHNQRAFGSNQLSSSAAIDEQTLAARQQQQAYFAQRPANRPTSGPAQVSLSYMVATNSSRSPTRPILEQQCPAQPALRPTQLPTATQDNPIGPSAGIGVRKYSSEVVEAADALLHYAGIEQDPGNRARPEHDTNGDGHLLSAAIPAQSNFRSSSKTVSGRGSEAARSQSTNSGSSTLKPSPSGTTGDLTGIRSDRHGSGLAQSHTRKIAHDHSASQRSCPSYHDTAMQTEPEPVLAEISSEQSHEPSLRHARPHTGSKFPMSDHAATYLDQWNSSRAALSSRSRSTASDVSTPQLSRSGVFIPVRNGYETIKNKEKKVEGRESRRAAEAGTKESSRPKSVHEGAEDVDVAMASPEVEILEDSEPYHREARTTENNPEIAGKDRDGEKHPRDEKMDGHNPSKEHKGSDDIDILDARTRNSKDWPEQFDEDDEDDDVQITSWKTRRSKKSAESYGDGNAEAQNINSGKSIKKGVVYVKSRESKGRKGRTDYQNA